MADASLTGLAKIKARLARLPVQVQLAGQRQLEIEAVDFIAAARRAALAQGVPPVAKALHYRDATNRVVGVVIISDPKDVEGKDIGSNIEAGHKARDGSAVRGIPSFFPTYRARKKAMLRRINKAVRNAARKAWGG